MSRVLIQHGEIVLKGNNRNYFESVLRENIVLASKKNNLELEDIEKDGAVFIAKFKEGESREKIKTTLENIFGIKYFSFIEIIEDREFLFDKIGDFVKSSVKKGDLGEVFNVRVKRGDKSYNLNSLEIRYEISKIAREEGYRVDFKDKNSCLYLRLDKINDYIYSNRFEGPGGLPVNSEGKVLVLLSGGVDSLLATWEIMKRGCRCDFIHFHNFPDSSGIFNTKISKEVELLDKYQLDSKLFLVPYWVFEKNVYGRVYDREELVLFKHYLLKFSERVAKQYDYLAIVTGDSVAQVASQTLENISTTSRNIELPILRPLITYNKEEIINKSDNLGLYEISKQEYKDCCSLTSKSPITRATYKQLDKILRKVDFEKILDESFSNLEEIEFKL